jgi:F-type H+-transporting ATPase subunit gamma
MSESLPILRHRMKTANDLRSVVKTMKAMAAASIAQFEQAATALEEYNRAVELSLALYFRKHPPAPGRGEAEPPGTPQPRRPALLVFGTDQGMVGQFNESIATDVAARLDAEPEPPLLWIVGGRAQFRLENAGYAAARVFPAPASIDAMAPLITAVLQEIERAWDAGQAGSVSYAHNAPLSRANYEMRWNQLLPLDRDWEKRFHELPWPTSRLPELVHESEHTLPAFVSEFLFVSLFKACAESLAAENGARLSAMQRAENNIDDRLREFRLAFNHARQKSIDEELFDLQAGFEALVNNSPEADHR